LSPVRRVGRSVLRLVWYWPTVPVLYDDNSITLAADEHALVVEAFGLAKRLCLDMDAGANRHDDQLVEVRLLLLIERLDALGLVAR
jgi:hypothetical protein